MKPLAVKSATGVGVVTGAFKHTKQSPAVSVIGAGQNAVALGCAPLFVKTVVINGSPSDGKSLQEMDLPFAVFLFVPVRFNCWNTL